MRIRKIFADKGFVLPHEMMLAKKWGLYLSRVIGVNHKQYDFIFVCMGYGDEYLLQTALILSKKLRASMIVDFRDMWSEHHIRGRFTDKQRKQVHQIEKKCLQT